MEKRLGKDYCELFDIHPDNVGWIDDNPVIFDYVACIGGYTKKPFVPNDDKPAIFDYVECGG